MPRILTNGIQLAYAEQGAGEPLLLISGIGYDRWQWWRMLPGLARQYRVLTPDNRGVGASDRPAGHYSAELLADDMAGLLDALGLPWAHVLGHSMGGFVAQALALKHPGRVGRLILASTHFGGPNALPVTPEALAILSDTECDPATRALRGLAVSCAPGFAEANPELIRDWLAERARQPLDPAAYGAQLAIGAALASPGACFEPRLKTIRAPTLILFGAQDRVVPPGNGALLARAIPGSRLELIPDAGHFFPMETPEAANRAVLGCLEGEVPGRTQDCGARIGDKPL